MRYRYDVEFTGYLTVEVEADSEKQAEELATEAAEDSLKATIAWDMPNISFTTQLL